MAVAVTQHLTLLCIAAVLYMCAGVWLVSHPHRSVLPIALFTLCALSVLSVCACSGARLRTQTAASSGRVWLLNVSSNHRHIAAAAQCAGPLDDCVVWMLWCALAVSQARFCGGAVSCSQYMVSGSMHAHLCCNVISLAPIQLRN